MKKSDAIEVANLLRKSTIKPSQHRNLAMNNQIRKIIKRTVTMREREETSSGNLASQPLAELTCVTDDEAAELSNEFNNDVVSR